MTKPTPPPVPAPPTEPQYTYCPGCRRRIQPGQSVEAVEHGDPWQSLWHTKCRPVPAPVDVEAVVRRFHHLPCKLCRPGPGQLCARALDIRAAVQFVLAARSAPVDAALLAQCREALEDALAYLKDIPYADEPWALVETVRAALLAIKDGTT